MELETYQLRLEQFSGPLDKLLELIEERKLEVTRLSLAEVTADFLKYIESLEEINPKVLADFIAVAAKLILIKSHTLLPGLKLEEDEEKEIADLEKRLQFYREFRPAEENIQRLWQKQIAFGRPYLVNLPPGFYLSETVQPSRLLTELNRMAELLQSLEPEVKQQKIKLVTLEEKIEELIKRLDRTIENSFNDIARGRKREEIIVLFLALLHLLKDAAVRVEQETLFSDIRIKTRNGKSE